MKLLFIHPSFPGQFKFVAPHAAKVGHEVVFLSMRTVNSLRSVRQISYSVGAAEQTQTALLQPSADVLSHALAARRVAELLLGEGFYPDVIIVHPGWGEAMFIKDVFPKAKLIAFLEYFFTHKSGFSGFDGSSDDVDASAMLRIRNAPWLQALNEADWNVSPTRWQKSLFPETYQDQITVLHEGIDCGKFSPVIEATLALPNGKLLKKGMEVITFVSRYLEPIRGLNTALRAAKIVLEQRPLAQVLVIGEDGRSYGNRPRDGKALSTSLLEELDLPPERVHFLGTVPQSTIVTALQISMVHLFLTYPFLISWSVLEALACECVVVASDTGPVRDIITNQVNGILLDFFDHEAFASTACKVLSAPTSFTHLGNAGRAGMLADFNGAINMRRQLSMIENIAAGGL